MEADQIIAATGQTPNLKFLEQGDGAVKLNKRGLVQLRDKSRTRTEEAMIFAGGDAASGWGTVIWAISDGHAAAEEIDAAIRARKR